MTQPNAMLESLAERGAPRGATTVLRDARRDAARHRRHRAVAGGMALATVVTSAVGAVVYLTPEDEVRSSGVGSGAQSPAGGGGPQTLTGITVEGHEGFDRIVLRFNVDQVDMRHNTEHHGFVSGAECEDFDPLGRPGSTSASETAVVSATAPGEDGLVPGLADVPVAGDTTYVRDVTALCEVDGYAWLTIAHTPLVQGGVAMRPGVDFEDPDRIVAGVRCAGGAPGEMYIDVYERRPDDSTDHPPGACAG